MTDALHPMTAREGLELAAKIAEGNAWPKFIQGPGVGAAIARAIRAAALSLPADPAAQRIAELEAEVARLKAGASGGWHDARIAELEAVLKPFAKEAAHWTDKAPDDFVVRIDLGSKPARNSEIKVQDLRAARTVLEHTTPGAQS